MRFHRGPAPWIALLLMAPGCASGGMPDYNTAVQVGPPPSSAGPASLPPLPVSIVEGANEPAGAQPRISNMEVVNQDIRTVVRSLAESFGLGYQLDPGVTGRVTTHLQDVTLDQALKTIVQPYGYTYSVDNGILRVVPAQFTTRIFTLDYMSLSRFGTGTTVVQRRLGATGSGSGGLGGGGGIGGGGIGGGAGGGGDFITSVTVSDIWAEIRIALEGLIFGETTEDGGAGGANSGATAGGASGAAGGAGAAGAGGAGGAGAQGSLGPGATSRVDAEGRRLIINPAAGTILVSASPQKIEEVNSLLTAIQGSIHRQVLIEARIVEVRLNQQYEFGIDWSALQSVLGLDFEFGTSAAGAQLTISNGGDADRQVGFVLNALESQGDVNVLSAPRVSALNNQRATINVATDEVFFAVTRQPVIGPNGTTIGFNTEILPQQVAVGIVLDVHPQIAVDNTITMNIRPVITDLVEVREVRLEDGTQVTAPVIDRRETDTVVRVRDGETIVIGGLMRTSRVSRETGVPVLSKLPLIGRLFGGRSDEAEKRELVIFITPTIVAGQPPLSR